MIIKTEKHEVYTKTWSTSELKIKDVCKHNNVDIESFKKWSALEPEYRKWYNMLMIELDKLDNMYRNNHNIEMLTLERIFPYGIKTTEIHSYVIIPKEYQIFSDDHMAYLLVMIPANRNFWFLLTTEEKLDFYNFLKKHNDFKLKHVSKINYTCGDLLEDLVRFQIGKDNHIIGDILMFGSDSIHPSIMKSTLEPDIALLRDSLEPFKLFTFNNMFHRYDGKQYNYYIYEDIPYERPRVSLGQYIISSIVPKTSMGY